MDRARRWFLLSLSALLSAFTMPPRRKQTTCSLTLTTAGSTLTAHLSAKARPSTSIIRWAIQWGDGTGEALNGPPPSSRQHIYAASGAYTVVFMVWDSSGGSAAESKVGVVLYTQPTPGGGAFDELTATEAERYAYYCEGGYTGPGQVRTVTGLTDEDVQDQIDAASHGDIVCMPTGDYEWATNISVTKDVLLLGEGAGTNVTCNGGVCMINLITDAARGAWRVSGMTINPTVNTSFMIQVSSNGLSAVPTGRWRIDHLVVNAPTTADRIHISGVTYGVIDHNTFNDHGGVLLHLSQALANECAGDNLLSGDFAMRQPFSWGGADMVFFEDNTVVANGQLTYLYDITGGGGRAVIRDNLLQGTDIYKHWVRGCEGAGGAIEVYGNTIEATAAWGLVAGHEFMRLESGTALVYNNHLKGNWSDGNGAYIILDERRGCGYPEDGSAGGCSHLNGPAIDGEEAAIFGFCGDGGEPATNTDPGSQSDDFAGTGALSGSWTVQVGTPQRVGDVVKGGSAGHNYAYWSGRSWPFFHGVKATVQGADLTDVGLMLRASGTGGSAQGYMVGDGPSGPGIYKITSGSFALLQGFTDTFTTGDVISAFVTSPAAGAINVFKNGVYFTAAYDTSSPILSGSPGVYINDTTAALDEWVGHQYGWDFAEAGAHAIDGNAGDPDAIGWPCLNQIGRNPYVDITGYSSTLEALRDGVQQTSLPLSMWNNGPEASCTSGTGCTDASLVAPNPTDYIKSTAHPNGDKDYQLLGTTPLAGYTAYTNPHPKQSEVWP